MVPFAYSGAGSREAAIQRAASTPGAEFIAGGTDMIQLLAEGVRAPSELIDINALPLDGIEVSSRGARIGALARMAEVADDPRIQRDFPAVSEALLASASPQVRNMASIGGNLLQRTRCLYFRDAAMPCNKRRPGSGCPAQDGANRINAVLGASAHCNAAYPGDLAVALVALDAEVELAGPPGPRTVALEQLHRLPGDSPERDTVLAPGDLIVAVTLPASRLARTSRYVKVRDRASFEWALASAAVALELDGGVIRAARVVVGGVATKPWRLRAVERLLADRPAHAETYRTAAAHASDGAEPRPGNQFKVALLREVVERALASAGGQA